MGAESALPCSQSQAPCGQQLLSDAVLSYADPSILCPALVPGNTLAPPAGLLVLTFSTVHDMGRS